MELVNVKDVDGEPWEVGNFAGQQFKHTLDVALEALEQFNWAARGAWLSQEHYRTGSMPEGEDWLGQLSAKKLGEFEQAITKMRASASVVATASAYDPRDF